MVVLVHFLWRDEEKKPTSCLLPSFIITHVLINRQEEQDKQDAVVIYFELK